jgi:zinc-ribbon domain
VTDQAFRFCPKCGTGLVEGMPYCPKCGFNVEEMSAPVRRTDDDAIPRFDEPREAPSRRSGAPLIVAAVIVAAGLIGYALLTRPDPATPSAPSSAGPGLVPSLAPGATAAPSAPIVGLSIQSPRDGDVVATKEVTVIGIAPPGLRITRDISFFPDQHATVDSTGHWAIAVELNQGGNTLVFRIGDDRSTEQRIHVTFSPPAE